MDFMRNGWYVACWESDLTDRPLERTIIGEPVVLFRGTDGAIGALRDRCPHRGVPLSMGKVIDGQLQCAYHGLRFDCSGTCVRNPHVEGRTDGMRTAAFAAYARHGIVWVWMGEAGEADPSTIPDYGWFAPDNPRYAVVRGSLSIEADYRLVIDNLLDLSHAEYLHSNTVGTVGSSGSVISSVVTGEALVTVLRKVMNLTPSAVWRDVWKHSERIDQESNMTWRAPCNLLLDLAVMVPNQPRIGGGHLPSAHLLTPESAISTRYHFAFARDFLIDDAEYSDRLIAFGTKAFNEEDRPVIEAAQRRIAQAGEAFRFASFTVGDGGTMRARRMLDRLIAAEKAAQPGAPSVAPMQTQDGNPAPAMADANRHH